MLIVDATAAMTRTVPRTVAAIAAFAVLPAFVTRLRSGADFSSALLVASVFAGSGLGFAVEDPAAHTLASSPTTLAARRGLRTTLVAVVLSAAWLTALALAATGAGPAPAPRAFLPLFVAAGTTALAAAVRVPPDSPSSPGFSGVVVSLLGIGLIAALSLRFSVMPALRGAHVWRWWVVAALAALLTALASRDPASGGITRRRRSATGR